MSQNSHGPTSGLAVFVAATFAVAVATIAALYRVGVPDIIVQGLGPILALFSLAVVGAGARSADLASFLAARRGVPVIYGALGLPAVVAGIVLCLDNDLAAPFDASAIVAGVALGAIGYGPLIRRFGATSANDIVATRFSGSHLPILSAIVTFMSAALTALGGYRMAVAAVAAVEPLALNRLWAEVVVATVLAVTVVPGGLAGVIWCAAASAGEIGAIIIFGFATGWLHAPAPGDSIAALATSFSLASPQSLVPSVAATLAVAGYFALQPQSIASRSAKSAVRAGIAGTALCVASVAMATAPSFPFPIDLRQLAANPVAVSLASAVMVASALTLARVGVHASSRAFGLALADPPRPFPPPASVRLARMRGAQLAVVIGCAICDSKGLLDARTALVDAMALSLALTTPLVALAAIGRVGPVSASVGIVAALAVIAYRMVPTTLPPGAPVAIDDALLAAAAMFVAGVLTSLVAPRRGPAPTPDEFDPYASGSG